MRHSTRIGDEVEAVVDFRIEKGREVSCLDNMHYYGTALTLKAVNIHEPDECGY